MQKCKILQKNFHHNNNNQAEIRISFGNLKTQLIFITILGYWLLSNETDGYGRVSIGTEILKRIETVEMAHLLLLLSSRMALICIASCNLQHQMRTAYT